MKNVEVKEILRCNVNFSVFQYYKIDFSCSMQTNNCDFDESKFDLGSFQTKPLQ